MSEKYKKTCNYSNYVERFIILISTVTSCVSIFPFSSLVSGPIEIRSSALGLKTCVFTARIKNYRSVITKKEKKQDEIVWLGKAKLNTI